MTQGWDVDVERRAGKAGAGAAVEGRGERPQGARTAGSVRPVGRAVGEEEASAGSLVDKEELLVGPTGAKPLAEGPLCPCAPTSAFSRVVRSQRSSLRARSGKAM